MDSDSSDEPVAVIKKTLKVKFDIGYDSVRDIIFCEHKSENPTPEKPLMRTLFLSKVPPWATEDGLKTIFECNGPIQKVYLSKKASSSLTDVESRDYTGIDRFLWPKKETSGFKYAYIVYEKPSSMKKAMQSMDLTHPYIMCEQNNSILTGKNFARSRGKHQFLINFTLFPSRYKEMEA